MSRVGLNMSLERGKDLLIRLFWFVLLLNGVEGYGCGLRVRSNPQNIPEIFHKEMEQKHNKQLHTEEYSIEYSASEQQLIYEVIPGIFLEYSAR